ncbi:MAG TPA: hypothetical protein VNL13_05325 [Sulfolobales archaeon]|nr:hypothetical protein [Sulfolobales archaeon]
MNSERDPRCGSLHTSLGGDGSSAPSHLGDDPSSLDGSHGRWARRPPMTPQDL